MKGSVEAAWMRHIRGGSPAGRGDPPQAIILPSCKVRYINDTKGGINE